MRALVAVLTLAACGGAAPEPATPAPAATAAAPCFPEGPPLDARTIYERLERHAMGGYGVDAPPPERFGTCTITDHVLRDAAGAPVAELTCGVRILTRGIRDDLGLELGARGQDVLDRARGQTRFFCTSNIPGQARCSFERGDENDLDGTSYVVDGDVADVLIGADAETFFGPEDGAGDPHQHVVPLS
jgi:hypothetical protein